MRGSAARAQQLRLAACSLLVPALIGAGSPVAAETTPLQAGRGSGRPPGPPSLGRGPDECRQPASAWVFCSSFEESHSPWEQAYTRQNRRPDPGPSGLRSNHVGRLRIPAGRGGAGFIVKLPPQRKLYLRFYGKWERGYRMTDAHHGPGGLVADAAEHLGRSGLRPDGTDLISASLEAGVKPPHPFYSYTYYHGMYQDCPPIEVVDPPADRCFGDSLPCIYDERPGSSHYCTRPEDRPHSVQGIVPGRWYCIEQLLDTGKPTRNATAADGILDIWVDGNELGPFEHRWLRTVEDLRVNKLWLYLFFHKHHAVPGLLFDDVVVSTARVGCRRS